MKKIDMIKELRDNGYEISDDIKWNDIQKIYKDYKNGKKEKKDFDIKINRMEGNCHFRWIDLKDIYKDIYKDGKKEVEKKEFKTKLDINRMDLYDEIIKLMREIKGKSRVPQNKITMMFSLYNRFYLRHDIPDSGAAISRVYQAFKKITKGHV